MSYLINIHCGIRIQDEQYRAKVSPSLVKAFEVFAPNDVKDNISRWVNEHITRHAELGTDPELYKTAKQVNRQYFSTPITVRVSKDEAIHMVKHGYTVTFGLGGEGTGGPIGIFDVPKFDTSRNPEPEPEPVLPPKEPFSIVASREVIESVGGVPDAVYIDIHTTLDSMANKDYRNKYSICSTLLKLLKPYSLGDGVSRAIMGLLMEWSDWPHYSGNRLHPVPDPSHLERDKMGIAAAEALYNSSVNLATDPLIGDKNRNELFWGNHKYGWYRRSLAGHMLARWKKLKRSTTDEVWS